MKFHKGMIFYINGERGLECLANVVETKFINNRECVFIGFYVYNGHWYGTLNIDAKTLFVEYTQEIHPFSTITLPYEFKDGRCVLCGAKEETHFEDHICRMHKNDNPQGYIDCTCLVCDDTKFKEDEDYDFDDDIPF